MSHISDSEFLKLLNDCFHDSQTRQVVQQKLFDTGITNMEALKQSLRNLPDIIGPENYLPISFQLLESGMTMSTSEKFREDLIPKTFSPDKVNVLKWLRKVNQLSEDILSLPSEFEPVAEVVLRLKMKFDPPFQFYDWVERPQITEQLQKVFKHNWDSFRYNLSIPLNFPYLLLTGGSGSGKTRTGWEVPNILKEKIQEVEAHSVHVFFDLTNAYITFETPSTFPQEKPPRNQVHIQESGRAFSLLIASSYFFSSVDLLTQETIKQQIPQLNHLFHVVRAIRFAEKLPSDKKMVLFIQMDEFQQMPYLCLCILRYISDQIKANLFKKLNTLIIPILTGASSAYVSSTGLEPGATNYGGEVLVIPPFTMDESNKFICNVVKFSNPSINLEIEYKEERLHQALLHWFGGVPRILSFYGQYLSEMRPKFETPDEALKCVNAIESDTRTTSLKKEELFKRVGGKKIVMELLKLSFFEEEVNLDTVIGDFTIEQLQKTGFIFLTPIDPNKDPPSYRISYSPFWMYLLGEHLQFNIFDSVFRESCFEMTEEKFPRFVAAIFKAVFRLLTYNTNSSVKISIDKLFNDSAVTNPKSDNILSEEVEIQPDVEIRQCPDVIESSKYVLEDLRKIRVVRLKGTSNTFDTIDFTKGNTIVITKRREQTVDLFVPPKFGVQVKFSEYLSSYQPIRLPKERGSDPTVYLTPSIIKKEKKKMTKVKGTEDFIFVLITPKVLSATLQQDHGQLPKKSLFVCGIQALKKFARGFLSDVSIPSSFSETLEQERTTITNRMIEEEKTTTTITNVSSEEKEIEVEEFETKKRARKRKLSMAKTKTNKPRKKHHPLPENGRELESQESTPSKDDNSEDSESE